MNTASSAFRASSPSTPTEFALKTAAKCFSFAPGPPTNPGERAPTFSFCVGRKGLSNIVPKRGLSSQQVDELRVLLAMHMPDCA